MRAFCWTVQQFEETGFFQILEYAAYLDHKQKAEKANTLTVGGKTYRRAAPERARELA